MAEWHRAAAARNHFADTIESLTPQQVESPTLCDAWNGKQLLAHLVGFTEVSFLGFMGTLVRSGFDFDKGSQRMVASRIDRSFDDLVASLRSNASKSAPGPGFPEEMTFTDVVIHTQDLRRPHGLGSGWSDDDLRTALDFVTTHKHGKTLVHRPDLDGVELVATDIGWSFGSGDRIEGPAEAVLMGLAARPVLDELTGPGVARWQA